MKKFLFRQLQHHFSGLGWRTRMEVLVLIGIITLFLSGRLTDLFITWQAEYAVPPLRLTMAAVHTVLFMILLTGPFINAYLLPRQKGLKAFYTIPLTRSELLALCGFYTIKYQVLSGILIIPVGFALAASGGWAWLLLSLGVFAGYGYGFILLQNLLFLRIRNRYLYISSMVTGTLLYGMLWIFVFYTTGLIWFLDILLLILLFGLNGYLQRKLPDVQLEQVIPLHRKSFVKNAAAFSFKATGGRFFDGVFYVMFMKEWLSMWRNPRYRRVKYMTVLLYLAGLVFILNAAFEDRTAWMLLLTVLIIWVHYSSAFNDKYVRPDPDWYIKGVPVRFHQLWLTKFLSEFIYVLFLLIVLWLLLWIHGSGFEQQLQLLGLCFLFAFFVLSTMVTFRLMFYEDPRLAGYAYHFTVLFIVVMSVNYRLVGPLIGIVLMMFYLYKSYRYYKS